MDHGRARLKERIADRGVTLGATRRGPLRGLSPWRIAAGLLMLALFTAPLGADAQATRVYRIGVLLHGGVYFQAVDGLREGLRELGLEEGRHFVKSQLAETLSQEIGRAHV